MLTFMTFSQIKLDLKSDDTNRAEQTYDATAYRNTWIHQRRKRRLLLQQKNVSKDYESKLDYDGTSTIGTEAKKSKIDASNNELLSTDGVIAPKPPNSSCTSTLQSSQELNEAAMTDSINTTSCEALLQFSLIIAKSQYLKSYDGACPSADGFTIRLEFINGQKDALCQLHQYFRNKLEVKK